MRQTITFDGKEVEFQSSGATPVLYKQCFKKDLLSDTSKLRDIKGDDVEKGLSMLDIVMQLSYIMYCEANYKDVFNRLNQESYMKWLMELSPNAFEDSEVNLKFVQLWRGNTSGTSTLKN